MSPRERGFMWVALLGSVGAAAAVPAPFLIAGLSAALLIGLGLLVIDALKRAGGLEALADAWPDLFDVPPLPKESGDRRNTTTTTTREEA